MRLRSAAATAALLGTVGLAPALAAHATVPAHPSAFQASSSPHTVLASRHRVNNTNHTTSRWKGALDPASKAQVTRAYYATYVPAQTTPTGSTGNPTTCHPGTSSAAYRADTLKAINFTRDLAGLAPVTQDTTENGPAQAAALIMAANNDLSHNPPSTWACWTRTGHDTAGRSNLAEGYLTAGSTIGGYMSDDGTSNAEAGHRRWILNPFARHMGVGAVGGAEALYVINTFDTSRPNPAYVGWPTAGWFPMPMEPNGRWSVSAGDSRTLFGHAHVRVLDGTTPVPVHQHTPAYGYAQPTLVWEMPIVHPGHTYTVQVSGITKRGTTRRFTTTYTVRPFQPSPLSGTTTTTGSTTPATTTPATTTPATTTPATTTTSGSSCFLLVLCGS